MDRQTNTKKPVYPILLLPGTLCNEMLWENQIDILSKYTDVYVGDVTKSDSIEKIAEDVLKEAPPNFILAGLSLGGMVALEIMKQAPERVKKLALLDTNPHLPTNKQITVWKKFIQIAVAGKFNEITEKHLLKSLLSSHNSNTHLESIVIRMSEETGKEVMVRQMLALMTRTEFKSILPTINIKTYVLVGSDDVVCPVEMSKYIADNIADSELIIIDGAGHLSSLEQPEVVTESLLKLVI